MAVSNQLRKNKNKKNKKERGRRRNKQKKYLQRQVQRSYLKSVKTRISNLVNLGQGTVKNTEI